ncbi:MAG: 3-deoxy-7-phosphoheptulonate synthase [candidate division Zixibacteria bacterium]|nr:3-deoxy-7-phosphoheptulonate synthase [candidate division Zixibacteria bacterium]MDH3936124.1 3-deoxy-7-phosphoheptulonate synthase [candidate division Zixibacteria bacterium]
MIVVMKADSTEDHLKVVLNKIEQLGFKPHLSRGEKKTIVGVVGNGKMVDHEQFTMLEGVDSVVRIMKPYKLAGREFKKEPTVIEVGPVKIGGDNVVVMAGPCAVESREQTLRAADAVAEAGATILRGGAFKPRSSPYSFQGLGEEGLQILSAAKQQTGLPVVSEVTTPTVVELVASYADMLQVGARNMQNFALLEAVGRTGKPVLLKRGMMSTIEELLMSAEYILSNGNPNVILCERGIRTFETATRNTLDISAVPVIKSLSHLPVIIDPSHATGQRSLIEPMAKAAIAAGADGLIIEVHPDPDEALCDGAQSLYPADFAKLMDQLRRIVEATGRKM